MLVVKRLFGNDTAASSTRDSDDAHVPPEAVVEREIDHGDDQYRQNDFQGKIAARFLTSAAN
jgi:hypothetical protein